MNLSRRMFLRGMVERVSSIPSLSPLSLGPSVTYRDDEADQLGVSNSVLVVVEMSGGNDGINTLIPYGDNNYYVARPNLAIPRDQVLQINGEVGFHPSMEKMRSLYDRGRLAAVQGVGYPNPNRSHYESMNIWSRASIENSVKGGWLGRYLDVARVIDPSVNAVNIGTPLPFSLVGQKERALAIGKPERFGVSPLLRSSQSRDEETIMALNEVECNSCQEYGRLLEEIMDRGLNAVTTSKMLREAAASYSTSVSYPQNDFGNRLKLAAQLINSDLKPRIVYLQLGGFDTHANQLNTHSNLLKIMSDGIHAFYLDMEEKGRANDILIMTFSEFGRRVRENGSRGTDHGTAEPMFLIGGLVRGGLYGSYPSLTDLTEGDLKFTVDFRQIYASILEDWLGVDQTKVLGSQFNKITLF